MRALAALVQGIFLTDGKGAKGRLCAGGSDKAGFIQREGDPALLPSSSELLLLNSSALDCCLCSLLPQLLLLLQNDPSGSGYFHSWPIHVTLQKNKKVP